MQWIRSLLFNILLYGLFGLLLLICWPAIFLGKDACRWIFKVTGDMTMWLCRVLLGITYEVRGTEKIPHQQALYACKHQSVWEAGALLKHLPHHVGILKKELMDVPIYGAYLRKAGMIAVDRKHGTKALSRMVESVQALYAQGGQLFMFPEGTRSAASERGNYKRGVAALYEALNVPVVPMALNSGVFWPRRQFLKTPGHVVLEFLDPIPPGLPRAVFMERLEDAIETASQRLYHEAIEGSNQTMSHETNQGETNA